jgi:adenylate cyclase class 2
MADDGGSMEVEVKARVEDLDEIRHRLRERGASLTDQRRETDRYLDHPDRAFADTDEALRVRDTEDATELTYKGPKVDETTKTREEIDLRVADPDQAHALLTSLGFEPAGRVVKQRETYRLDDVTITLDRVEGLGPFVEIEIVVDGDVDEAREAVLALADELGLDDRERRSYLELLLDQEG